MNLRLENCGVTGDFKMGARKLTDQQRTSLRDMKAREAMRFEVAKILNLGKTRALRSGDFRKLAVVQGQAFEFDPRNAQDQD